MTAHSSDSQRLAAQSLPRQRRAALRQAPPESDPGQGITAASPEHRCRDLTLNAPGATAAVRVREFRAEREDLTRQLQWAAEGLAQSRRTQVAAAETTLRRQHPLRALLRGVSENRAQEVSIAREMHRILAEAPSPCPEEKAWAVRLAGLRLVGAELAELPLGWHVLHGVPLRRSEPDLDHLLIGPAGIFTVSTTVHPRQRIWVAPTAMTVDGQYHAALPAVRRQAEASASLLAARTGWQIPVTPLVVAVGAAGIRVVEQPEDVTVLTAGGLVNWLTDQPLLLRADQAVRVFDAARRCATWHG